jgi:preprotein translocase subunit SecA
MVREGVKDIYEKQKAEMGQFWSQVEKMVLLQTIDARWKDHLQVIDQLKEGINLRAYAQKDPLIEYKKEGFLAFERMNQLIATEVVEKLMKIKVVSREETEEVMEERRRQQQELENRGLRYQGSEASDSASALHQMPTAPLAQPQPTGAGRGQVAAPPGFMSGRGAPDEGPKLNRAQRRAMEKKKNR